MGEFNWQAIANAGEMDCEVHGKVGAVLVGSYSVACVVCLNLAMAAVKKPSNAEIKEAIKKSGRTTYL